MSSANTSKKSKKQLKEQDSGEEGGEKIELTKEETQIAKFLRLQCPSKQATLVGMKVFIFCFGYFGLLDLCRFLIYYTKQVR